LLRKTFALAWKNVLGIITCLDRSIYQRSTWKYGLYSKWQSDLFTKLRGFLHLAFLNSIWLENHFVRTCNSAIWSKPCVRIRLSQKSFFAFLRKILLRLAKIFLMFFKVDEIAILFIPINQTYILKFHVIWQKEIFVPAVSNTSLLFIHNVKIGKTFFPYQQYVINESQLGK